MSVRSYHFVGGVLDGQTVETDGSDVWLVPHTVASRTKAMPDVPMPEVLIDLAIRHDREKQVIDRYERHEWVVFGKPAEYRYIFAGQL